MPEKTTQKGHGKKTAPPSEKEVQPEVVIRNYISLTQLVPELQQMVDEKKIALTPAYQLAALTPKEQALLLETIDSEQATPSLSQAQRMKKLSQSGELNEDTIRRTRFR